jgi:hypothetical protein
MSILSEYECYNTESGSQDFIIDYLNLDYDNIVIGVNVDNHLTIYCDKRSNFELIILEEGNYYKNSKIGNFIITEEDYNLNIWSGSNKLFSLTYEYEIGRYNLCSVIGYTIQEYNNVSSADIFEDDDKNEEYHSY